MSSFSLFDLQSFPPPQAIEELDFEALFERFKTDLIARTEPAQQAEIAALLNLEFEPATKLGQVHSYIELLNRQRINDAIRANLLAYAAGADLDHLAVFYDVIRLPGEPDDRLKLRVILAIQGRSTGGTAPRYRGVALGASLRVQDAVVYRIGTDPTVHVAVYSADNNGVPDAPLLALVTAALNAADVRMVNDTLVVAPAVFHVVNIVANVWLLPETPDTLLDVLPATLQERWLAERGLGFDMTRAWLFKHIMASGVQNVAIVAPAADVVAPPQNAISIGTVTLNNMGRAY